MGCEKEGFAIYQEGLIPRSVLGCQLAVAKSR